jgi:hypothetical protein
VFQKSYSPLENVHDVKFFVHVVQKTFMGLKKIRYRKYIHGLKKGSQFGKNVHEVSNNTHGFNGITPLHN